MRKITILFISFVCVLAFLGVCSENVLAAGKNLVGQKPPEIDISSSFNSKETLTLSHLKGRVVLVEFWATWCPPCKKAIGHLKDLHSKYASKGLVIIAITAEDKNKVKKFVQNNKMRFAVAIDNSRKTNSAYGVRSIPTAYLISAEGKVLWQGHTMNLSDETVRKALKNVKSGANLPVW